MKHAVFPGSFDPWHIGHNDILINALKVFDFVTIAVGTNPNKTDKFPTVGQIEEFLPKIYRDRIILDKFSGSLAKYVENSDYCAIIRGLRNTTDFEYEKTQQYWNEDLGIQIPTFYVICNRELVHISSSAIRAVEKIK